jgi:polyphosphate glucokinase
VVTPLELGHLPWDDGRSAEKHVAASVREDEELSWHEWGGRLRKYVAVLERILWPELIIVGGGVSAKHEKFFKYLKTRARLVPAEFFNQAGIVGAALWAEAEV